METTSKHRSGYRTDGKQSSGAASSPAKRRRKPDFLSASIPSIPAYDISTVTARCGEVNLPELESQARHFLHAYGKDVKPERTGNDYRDLMNLHEAIKSQFNSKIGIELADIGSDEGEIHQEFVAYAECDGFPELTVFFLPIRFVETLDEDLKDIFIWFLAFLEKQSPFLHPRCSYDMEYSLGVLDSDDDEINEKELENMSPEYREMAERYVKGDIVKYMDASLKLARDFSGDVTGLVKRLREKMASVKDTSRTYKTANGKEHPVSALLAGMSDGIDIHLEDSLFNYDLRFVRYELGDSSFYDYCDTDEIMDFDRLFMLTWGMDETDDLVASQTLENFNGDACNMCETVLLDVHHVSVSNDKIVASDYPRRWYEWFKKFLELIYE